MRLSPGQRVLLTTGDLRQILRVSTLPDSVSRVTSWDPIMGKSTGGLQSVLNEARLLPMAFEWEGDPDSRPQLRWVVLVRWGSGVTT
jgi:hypothetical protein